jgi:hypothetical protein
MTRMADCHPDRKHFGRGLCTKCHANRNRHMEVSEGVPRATCHPDRAHCARGLCVRCYEKYMRSIMTPEDVARKKEIRLRSRLKRKGEVPVEVQKAVAFRKNMHSKYRMTPEGHAKMVEAQGNKCFLCGVEFASVHHKKNSICVDHCHETGKVRKLLCVSCNTSLGHFEMLDSRVGLPRVLKYLSDHRGDV